MNQDYKALWDHAVNIGFNIGHALRRKLDLDETNFRLRAPYSHENSRNVYVYRAIDEAQKAATCLMRCKEFFSDDKKTTYNEDVQKQVMRVTQQAVFDEESMRCRKLIESLVDTILFLNTNEDIYFKDYFYLCELSEYESSQNDRKEFYSHVNRNSEDHIQWLRKCILGLEESGLEIAKRWYIREARSITSMGKVSLASFRSKYKKIALEQGPEIITLLAKSYLQAYGESSDIHFSANDTSHRFDENSPVLKANKVALLLIHLIVKLQEVSLIELKEPNDVLSEIRKKVESAEPYKELTTPQACVGDYVLAGGNLAKVIQEQRSKYGFYS